MATLVTSGVLQSKRVRRNKRVLQLTRVPSRVLLHVRELIEPAVAE